MQDEGYELHQSMKILPGSDGYNPIVCASNTDSLGSQDIINHIGAEEIVKTDETIIIIQEQEHEGTFRDEDRSRERYKNATLPLHTSIDSIMRASQANRRDKADTGLRGSSRFSKGHQDELDKVADRINKSILLNS